MIVDEILCKIYIMIIWILCCCVSIIRIGDVVCGDEYNENVWFCVLILFLRIFILVLKSFGNEVVCVCYYVVCLIYNDVCSVIRVFGWKES